MRARVNLSLALLLSAGLFAISYGDQLFATQDQKASLKVSTALTEKLEIRLEPLQALLDGCFTTSTACSTCHSFSEEAIALRDSKGANIAPYDLWQSTMMANASRDPLWRAMVSAEIMATPSRKKEIEEKCTRCHAPMASVEKQHANEKMSLDEIYNKDARYNQLALDGVSCTLCHQILPDNLGKPESYSGHFEISKTRVAFGPHKDPFSGPMIMFTDLEPTYGQHITQSELCATCHTLYTTPHDADGTPTKGQFLEQAPYLEWKNSTFATKMGKEQKPLSSCQDCHMPKSDDEGKRINTAIARHPNGLDFGPVEERSPYGRHLLVGGNTLIPQILAAFSDELNPMASAEAFKATEEQARKQLRKKTAQLRIDAIQRKAQSLDIRLQLNNRCGHKFPSAHPIRRAWLHLKVDNEKGQILFESGAVDSEFRLVDGTGKVLRAEQVGGASQPHFDVITDSSQVQIYSANMQDRHGKETHSLMRAASYLKDNRLLPIGWKKDGPNASETRPIGIGSDQNFVDGQDQITYRLPLAILSKSKKLIISARLLYQTLSSRHAAELFKYDTAEIRDLKRMLKKVKNKAELIDEHSKVYSLEDSK